MKSRMEVHICASVKLAIFCKITKDQHVYESQKNTFIDYIDKNMLWEKGSKFFHLNYPCKLFAS